MLHCQLPACARSRDHGMEPIRQWLLQTHHYSDYTTMHEEGYPIWSALLQTPHYKQSTPKIAIHTSLAYALGTLVFCKAGWCKTGLSEQGYGSYVVHA